MAATHLPYLNSNGENATLCGKHSPNIVKIDPTCKTCYKQNPSEPIKIECPGTGTYVKIENISFGRTVCPECNRMPTVRINGLMRFHTRRV